jgi:3-methyladenine DNA glycosylase AlkD
MLITAHGVLAQLKKLGDEPTKKIYMNHGAKEPVFGVKLMELKALKKKIKTNHELALSLYRTGNSDAMYFAGMIDDPSKVTKEQLDKWVSEANWDMLSERCVATLASKTPFGFEVAKKWIASKRNETKCAGYALYAQLFRSTDDVEINMEDSQKLLEHIVENIERESKRVQKAMNNCVIFAGIHVEPLHKYALTIAERLTSMESLRAPNNPNLQNATESILKYAEQGNIGMKIKHPKG